MKEIVTVKQKITIKGKTEHFITQAPAKLIARKGLYIVYEETLDDVKTNVRVKIEHDGIRIRRIGDVSMDFHFVKGVRTQNMYHLANGKLVMEVDTHELEVNKTDCNITIMIKYDLYQNDEILGTFDFQLEYEERQR